ncbi:O-antigen ligase family protein [Celerinatantimonas yamalensis]|uniref:O-antigen ligase family protein n=1 Tax=Celerinatantimonas yamalensis TaxID=559956 RepID=A0ABW9G800_9GAMM
MTGRFMNIGENFPAFATWWSSVAVAAIFAMALMVNSGYSYGASMLLLAALVMLVTRFRHINVCIDRGDRWLLLTFVIYGVVLIGCRFIHVFEIIGLDKPSRFIIGALVYLFLRRYPFKIVWFWYGLAVGAFIGVLIAFYQRFILDLDRANAWMHPIMFGDIGMLMGMLCLVGILYFKAKGSLPSMMLMALGSVSGILVSILSGSRGGWIAMPMTLFYIFWQGREFIGLYYAKRCVVAFILGAVVLVSVPQFGVKSRIETTITNVIAYRQGTHVDTSIGMRFEMWKAALYMFYAHPVLGVGKYDLHQYKQKLADRGLIDPSVIPFDHAHNEYLTNLSEYGMSGFILLILVYFVPLRLFSAKVKRYSDDWPMKSLAMAGVLVPVCYMDFALSQSMFSHNSGVMMYILTILVIWSAIRACEEAAVKD